jgi:hypothetical protein
MCLRRGGRKLHDELQTLIALPIFFFLSNPTKNQRTRNSYKIYSESLEGRDHFGDLVVDVMIRFVIVQWSDGNVIYVTQSVFHETNTFASITSVEPVSQILSSELLGPFVKINFLS